MKIVILTHEGDVDIAIDNAKLIKKLGAAQGHTALVVATESTPITKVSLLVDTLEESFSRVDMKSVALNERKDPNLGANHIFTPQQNGMFKAAVQAVKDTGNTGPWLIMDADTTPTTAGWIEALEEEYSKATVEGKKILGAHIALRVPRYAIEPGKFGPTRVLVDVVENAGHRYSPAPVVLPADFGTFFFIWKTCKLDPWDIKARMEFSPYVKPTGLIFHAHNSKDFTEGLEFSRPDNDKTQGNKVPKGAVLVHGCRDGSLQKVLSAEKTEKPKEKTGQEKQADVNSARAAALAARK